MLVMGIPARHVFWIAFSVAALPCIAFIILSYVHFDQVLTHIYADHTIKTKEYLSSLRANPSTIPASDEVARLHLEYDAMWNRQNRTNSALATRTWLRFMTACFGSILVFVGAIYLLSKIGLSEETEARASAPSIEFSFRSSSPGIIIILIGASLMVFPHFANQNIEAADGNIYMHLAVPLQTDESTRPTKTPAEQFSLYPLQPSDSRPHSDTQD